jgi:hypothetical protein
MPALIINTGSGCELNTDLGRNHALDNAVGDPLCVVANHASRTAVNSPLPGVRGSRRGGRARGLCDRLL